MLGGFNQGVKAHERPDRLGVFRDHCGKRFLEAGFAQRHSRGGDIGAGFREEIGEPG